MTARSRSVPETVREAFGARGPVEPLAGGEGVTFRVGDVVIKRGHDDAEAAWTQALQAAMTPDGFRLARPVPTVFGSWTFDGWSASEHIDGLRPAAPDWARIADAGSRFSDAAPRPGREDRALLARRTHRWAVADRHAWGEEAVDLPRAVAEVHDALHRLVASAGAHPRARIVHGDLAGNVWLDRGGTPVVLDVSPYVRPPAWAAAVVVGDAVLWHGADASLARALASDAGGRDLLGRALIYRLVAEALAARPRHGADLGPFRRVLRALTASS